MNEFTYDEYAKILGLLKGAGYNFVGYHETGKSPACIIRHDLDLDVDKALELHLVEVNLGIKVTYCVMVRTDAYNVFSKENTDRVECLLSAGHHLGLHFDCAAYNHDAAIKELNLACHREVRALERWFGVKVRVVSYHKPNALVLGGTPQVSEPLPHVYMRKYMKGMRYLSDSYGFWRYGHPIESPWFKLREPLNLAIHPAWWNKVPTSPLYSMKMIMDQRRAELREYMLTNLVGV